jgi:hypothetical protein
MSTTITFSGCVETHAGMEVLGSLSETGLSRAELEAAREKFEARGSECQLVDLVASAQAEAFGPQPACILIVHGGINALLPQVLF